MHLQMNGTTDRRKTLSLISAVIATGLAGCMDGSSETEPDSQDERIDELEEEVEELQDQLRDLEGEAEEMEELE